MLNIVLLKIVHALKIKWRWKKRSLFSRKGSSQKLTNKMYCSSNYLILVLLLVFRIFLGFLAVMNWCNVVSKIIFFWTFVITNATANTALVWFFFCLHEQLTYLVKSPFLWILVINVSNTWKVSCICILMKCAEPGALSWTFVITFQCFLLSWTDSTWMVKFSLVAHL